MQKIYGTWRTSPAPCWCGRMWSMPWVYKLTAPYCHNYSRISHGKKRKKVTLRGMIFTPKLQTFLHTGKIQIASTRLRAPVKKSDKNLQLMKHGGRFCACLPRTMPNGVAPWPHGGAPSFKLQWFCCEWMFSM